MLRTLSISILALSLIAPVHSAQPASQQSSMFFGFKGGFMKPDGDDNDPAFNIGAVMGQPVSRAFSWEAEFNFTVADGEVGPDNNWDINNIAGYAVYRSPGDIGFKAKAGLTYFDTHTNNDSGTSLSMGIGAGFKVGQNGTLDVEYTQVNDHVDYISVGYLFRF